MNMAFVYILLTADGTRYTGSTIALERRLREHQSGGVSSTRNKRPLKLLAFRKFSDIEEAALWEKKYKRSHGQLERDIKRGIVTKIDIQLDACIRP